MQFKTVELIKAPPEVVFKSLKDIERYENAARRRGVQIERLDDGKGYDVGAQWQVQVSLPTGKRPVVLELTDNDAPSRLAFSGQANWVRGQLVFDVSAFNENRTKMDVVVDFVPASLAARVVMQAIKLAQSSLNDRFVAYVDQFARDVELRYALKR